MYRKNFEEKIFIIGGINVLNNESQDWLNNNEINNIIEKMGKIYLINHLLIVIHL